MCLNLFDKLRICQSSSTGMCRLLKWFSCLDVAQKGSTMTVMGLSWQIRFLSVSPLISKLNSRSAWCRPGKMVGLGPWCTLMTVSVWICVQISEWGGDVIVTFSIIWHYHHHRHHHHQNHHQCTLLTVWVDMCADLRVGRKWDTLGQELVLPFL